MSRAARCPAHLPALLFLIVLVLFGLSALPIPAGPGGTAWAQGAERAARPAVISAGGVMNHHHRLASGPVPTPEAIVPETGRGVLSPETFYPGAGFVGYDFTTNVNQTGGYVFIPPDPIGASGPDRVLAVVNVGIECRSKSGGLYYQDALKDFFSPLGTATLGTFTFDPKVVFDPHANRFVVVALEQTATAAGDPANASRILLAVSKTATPISATSSAWWFLAIDSNIRQQGRDYWADYPGLEVDEDAVYVTVNYFGYTSGYLGARLWIVDKGLSGGFYDGGTGSYEVYAPTSSSNDFSFMPAKVFGAGGPGTGIGTFLVSYNSLTNGGSTGHEYLRVVRVDDPLGASGGPVFTQEDVDVGNIEDVGGIYGFPALPDAPQLGDATHLIAVNDPRAYDAVWRDGALWVVSTINPRSGYDATNSGQATAHWWKLDTSAVTSSASPSGLLTLADQGNLGAEDLGTGTYTWFPSVAVNGFGETKFGFAASSSSIYAGAYMAGREPADPAGTVQATGTVRAGVAPYYRDFGDGENRWGDYSGISVDPSDDRTFWVFNQYAWTQGTPAALGTGRWKTAWRACSTCSTGVSLSDICVGGDLCAVTTGGPEPFAYNWSNGDTTECLTAPAPGTYTVTVTDDSGCTAVSSALVSGGPAATVPNQCAGPDLCVGVAGFSPFTYNWSNGATTKCLTSPAPGTYTVTVTDRVGCTDIGSGTVYAPPAVTLDGGCLGADLCASPTGSGPFTYDWSTGATDSCLTAPAAGTYTVTVTDAHGCTGTSSAAVGACGPVLSVDPTSITMPLVTWPDTVCSTIQIKNLGSAALDLISFTGCDSAGFFVDLTGTASSVAPGDSTTFDLCFYAYHAGAESCEVTIDTNDVPGVVTAVVSATTGVSGDVTRGPAPPPRVLPNPFGSATAIRFTLAEASPVRVEVFDFQGRRVRTLAAGGVRPAGTYDVSWDGRDAQGRRTGAGVYFVRVDLGGRSWTTRAVKMQ